MSTRLELSPEELDLMLAALHAAALRAVAGPGGQRLAAVIQDLHAKVEIAQLANAAGIRPADAESLAAIAMAARRMHDEPASSACSRATWCVRQTGHHGECMSTMPHYLPDGSVIP